MKPALLAAALLSGALLAGCPGPPVAGEVLARSYTPPRIEYRTSWVAGRRGVLYGVEIPYTVPESFELRLLSWEFDREQGAYEPRLRWVDVAPEVFHAAVPGDWYSYEPSRAQCAATGRFSESLAGHPLGVCKPLTPPAARDLLAHRHRRPPPEP